MTKLRKTVTQETKTLTETDSPAPLLQNTHSCVLVLGNMSPKHLKTWKNGQILIQLKTHSYSTKVK